MSLPPAFPLDNGRSLTIVTVSILLPVIATFAVVGRFASRYIRKVGFGIDDWLIIPALLAVYGQMMLIILSTVYGGIGRHIDEVSPENIVIIYKILAGAQFTFGTSLGLVKISLCCLLVRIFFNRTFKFCAYIVMAYCACWAIMTISIGAGLCRPFAYNWDHTIEGTCGDQDSAYIAIAALDIVGDLAIIVLPMPMIWKLQIGLPSKLGLSVLFALGFLDVIVAILRIVYLTQLDLSPGADFTYNAYGTWLWSVIEPSLAVIIACGAVLKPLFELVFPQFKSFVGSKMPSRAKGYDNGYGNQYNSRNAQRLPDRNSDSDIPLHGFDSTTSKSKFGSSSTRAVGGMDTMLESGYEHEPHDKDDSIWVQRDITVQKD